jgi:heme-degrading monooxygenase HmoA
MTVIQTGSTPLTLINVFTVAPERQDVLIAHLQDATEQVMRHQRGFVSANIHASLDGTRVVNYAQWQTRQDFEAMLANQRHKRTWQLPWRSLPARNQSSTRSRILTGGEHWRPLRTASGVISDQRRVGPGSDPKPRTPLRCA